jgi:poly(3-hydroxybutyrate) depolymerase
MAGSALLCVVAACANDREPMAPAHTPGPPSRAFAAAALPPWLTAALTSLPPEAKTVWHACDSLGTMRPAGTPYVLGVNCRMTRIDGYPRRFVVYVPNHPNVTSGSDVPLVMMFHGSSQNGEHFLLESGWRDEADARGFIVAFGSGLEYFVISEGRMQTKWNSFELASDIDPMIKPPGYPALAPWPASDVAFTDSIMNDIIAQANIDTLRLHASGFSNGGQFTSRLGVERGNRIASIASITSPYRSVYAPTTLIPMFFGTGTLDEHAIDGVNTALTVGQSPITELPLDRDSLLAYAALQLGVDSMAVTLQLQPDTMLVTTDPTSTLMRWTVPTVGNTSGNEAWWGVLEGVQHEYPRGPGHALPQNNPAGFDAPRTFGQFFRAHHK